MILWRIANDGKQYEVVQSHQANWSFVYPLVDGKNHPMSTVSSQESAITPRQPEPAPTWERAELRALKVMRFY
ncbi:hypothetical protein FRC18_003604 [Serendipita sp. 400]|nr:hypothetical protein FRC18_003604 [Serendipita sp. 400]